MGKVDKGFYDYGHPELMVKFKLCTSLDFLYLGISSQ